jgi:hypothetical protein
VPGFVSFSVFPYPVQVIYQYAFNNALDILAGLKETETPYFQPTPNPPAPFTVNPKYGDPPGSGKDGWGLVFSTSSKIFFMGLAYTASSRYVARYRCRTCCS